MSVQTASAYAGTANVPREPFNNTLDLGAAYITPCGGRTFHVRGDTTGAILAYDDQYGQNTADMNSRLSPSVASVLPFCVANRGDTIIVHQNHTENIASAAAWTLVAGLKIIGLGCGNTRPTFTFTTAGSTMVVNVAGVKFQNCRWLCAGPMSGAVALTVTAPWTVSGEGCIFVDNYFNLEYSATQLCTTFCTVTADNNWWIGNEIKSTTADAGPTSGIVLGDATHGANGFHFFGNECKVGMGAVGTGIIKSVNSTGTAYGLSIEDNFMQNWLASSTNAIALAGNMVTEGYIINNTFRLMLDNTSAPVSYSGTGVDVTFDRNYITNNVNENGKAVATTSG